MIIIKFNIICIEMTSLSLKESFNDAINTLFVSIFPPSAQPIDKVFQKKKKNSPKLSKSILFERSVTFNRRKESIF